MFAEVATACTEEAESGITTAANTIVELSVVVVAVEHTKHWAVAESDSQAVVADSFGKLGRIQIFEEEEVEV